MRIFQKGFNYSQDGPGNRLVYHLQGCNMRCRWCSNPEGMKADGGWEISVEELVDECLRSRRMFFDGGGVTFTGGEPTMQFAQLAEAMARCKAAGIHTALETNGTHSELPAIWKHIDTLIMDFKHHDSDDLREYTGMGNETIKRNFETACRAGRPIHIRIPLINRFNTSPEGFAAYFDQWDTSRVTLELLAYHEYGREKWTEPYTITDGFVDDETVRAFVRCLRERGIRMVKT